MQALRKIVVTAGRRVRSFGSAHGSEPKPVKIQMILDDGQTTMNVEGKTGQTLFEALRANGFPLAVGGCEGNFLSETMYGDGPNCYFCHVWVSNEYLTRLPDTTDGEDNQLYWAHNTRSNSRLACNIELTEELDGITIALPPPENPELETHNWIPNRPQRKIAGTYQSADLHEN